mgnify:CR=1 FL=1
MKRFFSPGSEAEDLEKALKSGTYHDIVRGTDHISPFPDII